MSEVERADRHAAGQAGDHRDEGQQRQHDQQRQHARDHQQVDRVQAERADRIDFLAADHRADLRGERAGGAAGQHDGGQQHAEFAQEGDADQFDHVRSSAPKSRRMVEPRKAITAPTR